VTTPDVEVPEQPPAEAQQPNACAVNDAPVEPNSKELNTFFEELRRMELLPYEKYKLWEEKDFEMLLGWSIPERIKFLHVPSMGLISTVQCSKLLNLLEQYSK
jgi:hypothetical protein